MAIKKLNNASTAIKAVFSDDNQYAQFQHICVDSVNGHLTCDAKEANASILKAIWQVMGLPDNPSAKEVHKALRNTAKREAMFEILSETIEDTVVTGWEATPFFQQFVEVRNYNLGQENKFYIPDKTEFIVSKVSGSNHDMIRQRLGAGSELSVSTAYYGAKFYAESARYLMGLEDWTTLINKLTKAYTLRINTMLNEAVMGAAASLPNPTQWNKTGALDTTNKANFQQLIDDVATGTGTAPIIMGTKTALRKLNGIGSIVYTGTSEHASDDALNDIYNTGLLASFEGVQMAEIPQRFAPNDTTKTLIANNKILVMPSTIDKFVKMYYEGDSQLAQVMDANTLQDATYEYEVQMKFGIAVLTNVRFGEWTIA
jgi:hypothetical protein